MKVDIRPIHYLAFTLILITYVGFRLMAWESAVLLKDTDSLSYLRDIETFLSFNLTKIANLDPDSSLFYPFLGALFSLPGWSVQFGAELASFFSGIVLFGAVLGIGFQIARPAAIALGVFFLAINPELIAHSFTVLTEPVYVATIYLGIWLFWVLYKNPKSWGAVILGIIFGLAFLNRMEGILFIIFIPLMLFVYFLTKRPKTIALKTVVSWSLIYVLTFIMLAGVQVLRVSNQMNGLAINGRQVWAALLHSPLGKSYDEKIYGLNFNPKQINIVYLKKNPQELKKINTINVNYISTIVKNCRDLYFYGFPRLIGIFIFTFFVFGLFSLHQSQKRFEVFLILSFIAFGLSAPLLHNVVIRHILIVAPIMLLVAGIGVDFLWRSVIVGDNRPTIFRFTLLAVMLLFVIAGWESQIRESFSPPTHNREYSLTELKEPMDIIKSETAEWERQPIISARKGYLSYFLGTTKNALLPYSNYEQLVTYTTLNQVDYIYLKYSLIKDFPFLKVFQTGAYKRDFERLYRGVDAGGDPLELYRVRK